LAHTVGLKSISQ